MEKTYLMIKPEMVKARKQGEIIDFILKNGLNILRMKQFSFEVDRAEDFYGIHAEKPFFKDLIEYITSGDVIGLELEKENAVKMVRELVGATDPADARPGTIRYIYGASLQTNAVHASDSPESAEKELAIVFSED
ncbi:MAG: nucleoside-diphosphate kinase [Candidatus Krumholzibacteriota bacterium]|nr:nucleoside-diphosphate kinase [Candidatus Krumholzibacteriota bacterium]